MNNQAQNFGMNPNLPPVLNPAWNPNNWNQNNWNQNNWDQNQAIRNLENRVTRLEREVQRLNNRVNRLEQGFPMPRESSTYQTDSYNMM